MTEDLRDRPIGVFDSGMGGLTVMRALMARLPRESFVYLGDTARLPYGSKSPDTVTRYAVQCARALLAHRIKLLVVACNTASATALPALTAALLPTPVIGVIEPGAQAAVAAAPSGRIAVIATEGTVKGGAYERAIHARNAAARVTQQPCPLFVALAEEGLTDGPIAELGQTLSRSGACGFGPAPGLPGARLHAFSGPERCDRARGRTGCRLGR